MNKIKIILKNIRKYLDELNKNNFKKKNNLKLI